MQLTTCGMSIQLDDLTLTRADGIELAEALQRRATDAAEYDALVMAPEWGLEAMTAEDAYILAGQIFDACCKLGAARCAAPRLSGGAVRFVIA